MAEAITLRSIPPHLAPAPLPARAPLSPDDSALLDDLRRFSLEVLCGPPVDLDRACALIAPAPAEATEAHGRALLAALDASALRPLSFHPRGSDRVAFGEAWLLALLRAAADGDGDSATFLVGRMLRRECRRHVQCLARRFVEARGLAKATASV